MTWYPAPDDLVAAGTRADGTTVPHSRDHSRVAEIWENARGWGAKGDGAFDDTARLQDTLDVGAGSTVYLPAGTYLISAPLVVPTGTTVRGAGAGTIIKQANGANIGGRLVDLDGVNDVVISDLVIDGNRTNQSSTESGITVRGISSRNRIERVWLFRCSAEGINMGGGSVAFCQITGCHIEDVGQSGIMLAARSATLDYATQIRVTDCTIHTTGNHGIVDTGVSSVVIANNTIYNTGVNSISEFSHGVAVDGNGGDDACAFVTVAHNVITNAGGQGIEIADGVSDVSCLGNTIDGTVLLNGIYFGGSLAFGARATISANTINGANLGGILVAGPNRSANTVSVSVVGNSVTASGTDGIRLENVSGFSVLGNTCLDNDQSQTDHDGIRLDEVDNGIVSANRCWDDQGTPTQNYGFHVSISATDVEIASNVLTNNEFGGISAETAARLLGSSSAHNNIGA